MEPFEQVPYAVLIGLFVVFIYYVFGIYLARTRPATEEPVIGNYQIHMMGTGVLLEGIMTTARTAIKDNYVNRLVDLGPKVENFLKLIRQQHIYAIRDGNDKVLIISDKNLESQEYADSAEGSKWVFPFGVVSYRHVYAYGQIITDEAETLFNFFEPDWDAVVCLYPKHLPTGRIDFSTASKLTEVVEGVALIKTAALARQELEARDEVINLQADRLDEAYDRLGEQTDKAHLFQQRASLQSPFAGEKEEEEEEEGFLPSITRTRFLVIVAAAALGYMKLPEYWNVTQAGGAVIGAIAAYGLFLVWDNWLSE